MNQTSRNFRFGRPESVDLASTTRRAAFSLVLRKFVSVALATGIAQSCFTSLTSAQETVRLNGEFFVAGRHAVDPPRREPTNSHAYFTIEGYAALRMFTNMRSKEEKDLCRGEGWRLKRAGNLYCSLAANGKDAACDFSIDMFEGSLASGKPC